MLAPASKPAAVPAKSSAVRNENNSSTAGIASDARMSSWSLIAQSTVDLSRTLVSEGDQALIRGIEQQQAQTVARLKESEEAWAKSMTSEPLSELQAAMTGATELRAEVRKLMLFAEQEIAEAAAQEKTGNPADLADVRKQASNAQARLADG